VGRYSSRLALGPEAIMASICAKHPVHEQYANSKQTVSNHYANSKPGEFCGAQLALTGRTVHCSYMLIDPPWGPEAVMASICAGIRCANRMKETR